MLLLFVYRVCTYLCTLGLRLTVQVYSAVQGWFRPLAPAPLSSGSDGPGLPSPSSLARPCREKRSTTLLLFQLLCYCCCCCCSFCYHHQSPRNVKKAHRLPLLSLLLKLSIEICEMLKREKST